jgi:cytoplasmic polyadenylation element-binding protein
MKNSSSNSSNSTTSSSIWNYSNGPSIQNELSTYENLSLNNSCFNDNELLTQISNININSPITHSQQMLKKPITNANQFQLANISQQQSFLWSNTQNLYDDQTQSALKRPLIKSKAPSNFVNSGTNEVKFQNKTKNFQFFKQIDPNEVFSKKVFVGGLPPDIDEYQIIMHFSRFGQLKVDWPHKSESKSYFPPKGYVFLIFFQEKCVQNLINICSIHDGKYYTSVSSPSIQDKPVQIRPWFLNDSDFMMETSSLLNLRKTIFVGGVPRPIKARELAQIMNNLYGGVCYAGIDTDPELKYPKGAGRVSFSNRQSYIAAINARFVHIQNGDVDKRVEIKPYVLDDQFCDECYDTRCENRHAPYFCANVLCLNYYCESCWSQVHSNPGREYHKPLVKEGDRPRTLPYKRLNQL